jgi:hypothetical protein
MMFSTNSGSGKSIQHPLPLDTIRWTNIGSKNIMVNPWHSTKHFFAGYGYVPFVSICSPKKTIRDFPLPSSKVRDDMVMIRHWGSSPTRTPGTSSSCDTFEGLASRTLWNISDDWHWLVSPKFSAGKYWKVIMHHSLIEAAGDGENIHMTLRSWTQPPQHRAAWDNIGR